MQMQNDLRSTKIAFKISWSEKIFGGKKKRDMGLSVVLKGNYDFFVNDDLPNRRIPA